MYSIEFRQSSICVNQDFLTQITSRDCLIHVSAGYVDFKKSKKKLTQVQLITQLRVEGSESKLEASRCQKTGRNIWDREIIKESVEVQLKNHAE